MSEPTGYPLPTPEDFEGEDARTIIDWMDGLLGEMREHNREPMVYSVPEDVITYTRESDNAPDNVVYVHRGIPMVAGPDREIILLATDGSMIGVSLASLETPEEYNARKESEARQRRETDEGFGYI